MRCSREGHERHDVKTSGLTTTFDDSGLRCCACPRRLPLWSRGTIHVWQLGSAVACEHFPAICRIDIRRKRRGHHCSPKPSRLHRCTGEVSEHRGCRGFAGDARWLRSRPVENTARRDVQTLQAGDGLPVLTTANGIRSRALRRRRLQRCRYAARALAPSVPARTTFTEQHHPAYRDLGCGGRLHRVRILSAPPRRSRPGIAAATSHGFRQRRNMRVRDGNGRARPATTSSITVSPP